MRLEINYPNTDARIEVQADEYEEVIDLLNVALEATWGKSARRVTG